MKTLLLAAALGLIGNVYANTEVKKVKTGMTSEKLEVKSHTLNKLIRGELSAVETYNSALKKIEKPEERFKLETIRNSHQDAADKLKVYVAENEKKDVKDSGAWGDVAITYEKGASLFGNKTAVKALSQGEEHGLKEMKTALKDKKLPQEIKQMIETQLIPNQQRNLKTLKEFI